MNIRRITSLNVLLLIFCLMLLPCAAYAAGVAAPKSGAPIGNLPAYIGPVNDGQITNVTTMPAGSWYTGTTVKVQWVWPGFVNFPADVTLWSGSLQVATVISGWTNTWAGWNVPYNFSPGTYTVRVQSSKNQNNHSETTVRIENSKLTIVDPADGSTLGSGTLPIKWTYGGNVGYSVDITISILGQDMTMHQSTCVTNYPVGSNGTGQCNSCVFSNGSPISMPCTITVQSTQYPGIRAVRMLTINGNVQIFPPGWTPPAPCTGWGCGGSGAP
jgi:hypothetical protein